MRCRMRGDHHVPARCGLLDRLPDQVPQLLAGLRVRQDGAASPECHGAGVGTEGHPVDRALHERAAPLDVGHLARLEARVRCGLHDDLLVDEGELELRGGGACDLAHERAVRPRKAHDSTSHAGPLPHDARAADDRRPRRRRSGPTPCPCRRSRGSRRSASRAASSGDSIGALGLGAAPDDARTGSPPTRGRSS